MIEKIQLSNFDLKSIDDGQGSIAGYASVYDGVDTYGDTIIKGAYDDTARAAKPAMFYGHDHAALPIGRWTRLSPDEKGLYCEGVIDLSRESSLQVYKAVKSGCVTGLSVGIGLKRGSDYEFNPRGGRLIKHVSQIFEISVVAMPADNSARITDVKDVISNIQTVRDFEQYLRESGMSKSAALALCAKAKAVFAQCDAEEKNAALRAQIASRLDAINHTFNQEH